MFARIAILFLIVAGAFVVPEVTVAANLSRAQIRSMPITQRPSRPGHFYGNAVRRNTGRSGY